MSIIDNVKQHLSNNRGKYGAATGVGLAYGANELSKQNFAPDVNQALFNVAARGQNLALDAADTIGYGKDQLRDLGLENKINPDDIQAGNDFYNTQAGRLINTNPTTMLNAAEQSSGIYNKVQEAKAQAQDVVHQAKAQAGDTINQGVDYLKSLNPFNENDIMFRVYNSILETETPSDEPTKTKKKSFVRNAAQALKHPKYQRLLATNAIASAGGGVIGTIGGSMLLDKVVKPLTEDNQAGAFVKDKLSQDINFVKGIGSGVYKVGKGAIKIPYRVGRFIAGKTPAPVGSALRLGALGYAANEGIQYLEDNR